jgi:TM2 domain-containing membrane protein YozV
MDSQDDGGRQIPLSLQQKMRIDFQVIAHRPSKSAAYVLCVFFGVLGAHRFYLGDRKTGAAMLAIGITIIGLPVTAAWAIADLFRIPAMIRQHDEDTRERLTADQAAQQATARADQCTKRATTSR